jgi:hypothetical protein
VSACTLNELNAHNGIFIKESPGIRPVRSDAANHCCCVDEHFRLMICKEAFDCIVAREIEFTVSRRKNIAAT